MIDYESPVKVFQDEIRMQIEGEIFKAVQKVAVDVDKEELLKALKYDRKQYEKGFSDCETTYKKKIEDVLERLENNSYLCGPTYDIDGYSNDDEREVILLELAIEIIKEELME